MHIKLIKSDADHEVALRRIDELMDAAEGSPEADELEVLALLVEKYEESRWPIEAPAPVEVLRYVMDQRSLTPIDLVPYIGHRTHVYDVLNGKRGLSVAMIWKLHEGLGIPAELLIKPVRLEREPAEDNHADA